MTSWLLSIVGVVFLGVLIDIITPEGKINAFIKSIFGIFVLYIIISPLLKLLDKKYEFDYQPIELQESYLDSVGSSNIDILETQLQKVIEENGFQCFVEIDGNMWGSSISVSKITIFLPNSVLISVDEHINNCKVITRLVRDIVEVDEEDIIYERL